MLSMTVGGDGTWKLHMLNITELFSPCLLARVLPARLSICIKWSQGV